MVSTYHLVKLLQKANSISKKKRTNHNGIDEPLNVRTINKSEQVYEGPPKTQIIYHKCRVCLQQGNIPIFSQTQNTMSDLSQLLSIIGGIGISADDNYPKYLCKTCLNSLEAAIEFRTTAMKAELILKDMERGSLEGRNIHENYKEQQKEIINASKKEQLHISEQLTLSLNQSENIQEILTTKDNNWTKYFVTVSLPGCVPLLQCQICKKILNSHSSTSQHLTIHLPDVVTNICEICGKTFKTLGAFNQHMFIHNKDFPFKCELCPYKGRAYSLLTQHKKVHSTQYNFMCSQCPKQFLLIGNLNSHLRRHGQPMFKCETCDKPFYERHQLNKHLVTQHLGIKEKFPCNECGKLFSKKWLRIHQNRVHMRKKVYNKAHYHNAE